MDFKFPPPRLPELPSITEILAVVLPVPLLIVLAGLFLLRNSMPVQRFEALGWLLAVFVLGGVVAVANNQTDIYAVWAGCLMVSVLGLGFAVWRFRRTRAAPVYATVAALAVAFVAMPFTLPARVAAREAWKRTRCKDSLKQLGLIFRNVADGHGGFPPAESGEPPRSWRVELLPFMDQGDLRRRYDDQSPWDHPRNEPVAKSPPSLLTCPQNFNPNDSNGRGFTAYAAVTGEHAATDRTSVTPWKKISDGLASTILLMEACGQEIVWTEPRDVDLAKTPIGINLNGRTPTTSPGVGSSYHDGGCQVVLADGSVRFISQNIDPATLKKLLTADDGEDVGEF
ncbi:MAG TPA: DUF1559 domain-containing protein [Caulifigura sp.]|nr:DUF1559 domain-containing protein [Caulifigura sp.]